MIFSPFDEGILPMVRARLYVIAPILLCLNEPLISNACVNMRNESSIFFFSSFLNVGACNHFAFATTFIRDMIE